MCHFITMVVPGSADKDLMKATLRQHSRGFEVIENSHVEKKLARGEVYFCTTDKYCDCGTALGSYEEPDEDRIAVSMKREIAKHRRLGWSETKIERWQADKYKNTRKPSPKGDPDGWVSNLRSLLALPKVPYVGILLHWYDGDPSSARIDVKRVSAHMDDTLADRLWRLEEDTLLVVS